MTSLLYLSILWLDDEFNSLPLLRPIHLKVNILHYPHKIFCMQCYVVQLHDPKEVGYMQPNSPKVSCNLSCWKKKFPMVGLITSLPLPYKGPNSHKIYLFMPCLSPLCLYFSVYAHDCESPLLHDLIVLDTLNSPCYRISQNKPGHMHILENR